MCLLNLLISVFIIGLLYTGGAPTMGEVVMMVSVMVVAGVVLNVAGNRMAEGFLATFMGGGQPAGSSSEAATDTADGYFQQQEYDTALYEYEQALKRARGPARAPILLRLAETAQLADRREEALEWWNQALRLKKGLSDEQRASAMFRMAEVMATLGRDAREVARMLDRVRQEFPASRFASYAESRLAELVRPGRQA